MPPRVEVWAEPPPRDFGQWEEIFECVLEVDGGELSYGSPTMEYRRCEVPDGRYGSHLRWGLRQPGLARIDDPRRRLAGAALADQEKTCRTGGFGPGVRRSREPPAGPSKPARRLSSRRDDLPRIQHGNQHGELSQFSDRGPGTQDPGRRGRCRRTRAAGHRVPRVPPSREGLRGAAAATPAVPRARSTRSRPILAGPRC